MTDKNTFKKVGIASFIMMASVFASRLIGVFREISIAGIGGIQSGVDAYQIAFVLPEILNHIVASGFLSITFIPIFTGYLTRNKEQEGYKVFSIIHNGFGLFLISLILIAMIWASELVHLIAPGITDPDTFAKAVKMTRIILPAQFFFFSGGLLMAIQFSHEKFFIPALAPLIYNIFIITGGLVLGPFIGMEGFAWGVLIGAVTGNFALQLIGTRKLNIQYSPVINFTHPDLIRYTKLTLPLMLGLTMTFSTELQFKFFGSFLPPGSIAAINYALRITFLIVGLFGQAVGVASYPFMAKLAGSGRLDELNQLLNQTLKYIFLVIPVSILFIVLSHEIVLILFQRWEFDAQATRITRGILPFFMIGAFAFSAQTIVSRGYYAMQNTLFPTLVVSLCVILSVPLTYFLMLSLGAKGVALGLSVSAIIQCLVLFECWSKKSKNTQKKQVYFYLLKLLPISLVMGLILFASAGFLRQIFDTFTFSGAMNIALITGIEFLLIFYAAGRILKITEIFLLYENTYKRIISWKKKINLIAQKINASKRLIVFTGAGISTESGIPDYRSQGGLWTKFQPIYFDEFMSSKDARIRYWDHHLHMGKSLMTSKPNIGHDSITALYTHGFLNTVITQNIDGLHQKSGIPDKDVIELHGNATRVRCMSCRCLFTWEAALDMIKQGNTPPECNCSGYLKPDTISFGQSMPVKETQKAAELSSQSDVFIVVGSTLIVQPAALMPKYAKDNGAFLVIINLSETPYDSVCDVLIREKAGTVLEQIAQKVLHN